MSLKVALSELSPPSPLDGHLFVPSHLFCCWHPEDYDKKFIYITILSERILQDNKNIKYKVVSYPHLVVCG